MSINDVELTAGLLAELYPVSLVQPAGDTSVSNPTPVETAPPAGEKKALGENQKQILVVVSYADVPFLPDTAFELLSSMLTACKLSVADVAIVNIYGKESDYKSWMQEFSSRIVLLFNIEPVHFGLPMNFPQFQIQPFNQASFLYAPSLDELDSDKVLKSKLWVSLRRLFNI